MKRNILSLVIATVLCILFAQATGKFQSDDTYPLSDSTVDPQNAYTQLMQSFGPKDTDTITSYAYNYPDWYGGSYIDGDILYVNLTTDDTLVQHTVQEACGDFADVVRFHQVSYSLNCLLSLSEAISLSSPNGLISVGVDEISNCVLVEVDSDQNSNASQMLSSIPATLSQEAYSPDMLSIQVTENDFQFLDTFSTSEEFTDTSISLTEVYPSAEPM